MELQSAGSNGRRITQTARQGGVRVARGVKRRLARERPATPRDPSDPRLLFRPGNGKWYVADGERWYEPSSESDLDALLTLLPAEVLDEQILASAGSVGGIVRVIDNGGTPTLEFLSSFGEIVRRTANMLPGLGHVVTEWVTGAHADSWVETSATLRLDGVRRCRLTAYLPDGGDEPLADKELAVQIPKGRRTIVDIHHLRRGEQTTIDVYRSRTALHGTVVTLQTSAPEPADDDRPLGFIAVGLEGLA